MISPKTEKSKNTAAKDKRSKFLSKKSSYQKLPEVRPLEAPASAVKRNSILRDSALSPGPKGSQKNINVNKVMDRQRKENSSSVMGDKKKKVKANENKLKMYLNLPDISDGSIYHSDCDDHDGRYVGITNYGMFEKKLTDEPQFWLPDQYFKRNNLNIDEWKNIPIPLVTACKHF